MIERLSFVLTAIAQLVQISWSVAIAVFAWRLLRRPSFLSNLLGTASGLHLDRPPGWGNKKSKSTRTVEVDDNRGHAMLALVMRVLLALALIGAIAFLASLMHGCSSPGDVHTEAIVAAWKQITADGRITPEEATFFAGVLSRELGSGSSINWWATVGSVVGSLATGALGLRIYHNQAIAPVLDSIASLQPPPAAAGTPDAPGRTP